jgi:argininosuccinate lyase
MRKGRLNQPAAELAQRYSESVCFDWLLYPYDIAGSIAHAAALVGELVVHSITKSVPLDQIAVAEMKKFSPHFNDDVAKIFDVRDSLAQRRAIGAPSPENIAAQIKRWKELLAKG